MPLVTWLHGGYGVLTEIAAAARFIVPDGLLASFDDPLRTASPAGGTVIQHTFWCGYQDGLNRFDPRLPDGDETVRLYTARRVWWETQWLVGQRGVDPERVSLSGPSMGGVGTLLHSHLRPDLYAAGLAYVPLLGGTRRLIDPERVWWVFGSEAQALPTDLPGGPALHDLLEHRQRQGPVLQHHVMELANIKAISEQRFRPLP